MTKFTWNMLKGTGNFTTAANWSPNGVPGAADDAILPAAPAGTDYFVLDAATITVGSLQTGAGALFRITSSNANAHPVFTANNGSGSGENAGYISIGAGGQQGQSGATFGFGGTMKNTGVIELFAASGYTSLDIDDGTAQLTGGGQVIMGGDATNNFVLLEGAVSTAALTNVDNWIYGGGIIDLSSLAFTNAAKGIVDATNVVSLFVGNEATGAAVTMRNAGVLEATNPGGFSTTGGLLLSGVTVINSATGVIEADGQHTHVDLAGATINGGTLRTASGGVIGTTSGASVLDGYSRTVFNQDALNVAASTTLTIEGTISNSGTIALASGGKTAGLSVGASAVFSGHGSVVLGASGLNTILSAGAAATLTNVDNTLSGAGTIGDAGMTVVNESAGVIDANENQALLLAGKLTNAGTILAAGTGGVTVAGSLTTTGTIGGAGALALTGSGKVAFNTGTKLTIAAVTQNGSATAATFGVSNLTYAGLWTQAAGTVSVSGGDRLTFTGHGNSFAGSLTGAGTVAFSGGSDTLTGATLSAASVIINGAAVTLRGAIGITHVLSVTTSNLNIDAGATLGGGGSLVLSNLATNRVSGAGPGAKLTNNDRIFGAGFIGGANLTLVNGAGGLINADDSAGLVISTGGNTIINAGLIEATGAGGAVLKSAVDNTGLLYAAKGNLTVDAPVSGSGSVRINAATADFASSFSQNVTFTGSTGILELSRSQAYAGTISGFSKTGTSSLDLADIAFGGTTKATYSGTTTSGVLTVTDGKHTARITLLGDYTGSQFLLSKDANGGTVVIDPAGRTSSAAASVGRFITIAASFGASAAGLVSMASEPWRATPSALVAPRSQLA